MRHNGRHAFLAALSRSGVALVQMTPQQSAADAACDGSKGTSSDGITDERTAHTAGDSSYGAVAAATAITAIYDLAMVRAVVPVVTRLRSLRDKQRPRNERRQGDS